MSGTMIGASPGTLENERPTGITVTPPKPKTAPTPPYLNHEQLARVEALTEARKVIEDRSPRSPSSAAGSSVDATDLLHFAQFILTGEDTYYTVDPA